LDEQRKTFALIDFSGCTKRTLELAERLSMRGDRRAKQNSKKPLEVLSFRLLFFAARPAWNRHHPGAEAGRFTLNPNGENAILSQ